jgi:hypothetical protein
MRHAVVRRQNATILGSCLGAGDENSGSHFAGDGEEDHAVAGSGDHWDFRPLTEAARRATEVSGEEKAKADRSCTIKTGRLDKLTTALSSTLFSTP